MVVVRLVSASTKKESLRTEMDTKEDAQTQQHQLGLTAAVVSPAHPIPTAKKPRSHYLHKLDKVTPDGSSLFELHVGMGGVGGWLGRSKSSSDLSSLKRDLHSDTETPDNYADRLQAPSATTTRNRRARAVTEEVSLERTGQKPTVDTSKKTSKTPENRSTPKSPYLMPSLTARSGDKLRRGLMTRLKNMPPAAQTSSRTHDVSLSEEQKSRQNVLVEEQTSEGAKSGHKTELEANSLSHKGQKTKRSQEHLSRFSVAARRATVRARKARKRELARVLKERSGEPQVQHSDESHAPVIGRSAKENTSLPNESETTKGQDWTPIATAISSGSYCVSESRLVSNPLSILDRSSPLWYNARKAKECHSCGTGFSLLVRKHHCRACGLVMCSDCVPRSTVVSQHTSECERIVKVIYPPERGDYSVSKKEHQGRDMSVTSVRICHFCRVLSNGSILPMPRVLYFLKLRYIENLQEKLQEKKDASEEDKIKKVIQRVRLSMPKDPPEGSATLPRIEHDTTMWLDAVARGDTTEVELRLALGQDVNAQERTRGRFALYVAAENDHTELMGLLLSSHQPILQLSTFDSQTALHVAAAKGHRTIVRLLLRSGVPEGHVDVDGETAIMKAVKNGHYSIASFMSREHLPEHWRQMKDVTDTSKQKSSRRIRFSQQELEQRYNASSLEQRLEEFPKVDISKFFSSMREYGYSEEPGQNEDGEKLQRPSRTAMALPLPPRDQLLSAGLGVLDPAAQALQANLLAVKNVSIQRAQMQQWKLDTSLPDRLSIWEELGFVDSRERFAVPSPRTASTSGHYETEMIATAWRIGHSLGSDVDVSDWLSQIFETRRSSAVVESVENASDGMTPKDIAGDLFSNASTGSVTSAGDSEGMNVDLQIPLAEEVESALSLTTPGQGGNKLEDNAEEDDEIMELLEEDNFDDDSANEDDDDGDDEDEDD